MTSSRSSGHATNSTLMLVRHGVSARTPSPAWVRLGGMALWRDEYDAAGISAAYPPPARLVALADRADLLVASDLPRAVDSVRALASGRPVEVTALLRESPLEVPPLRVTLPVAVWDLAAHAWWSYRILRRRDVSDSDQARADAAAEWLTARIARAPSVLAVTHGVFRRILARTLVARGWERRHGVSSYAHWSVWTLVHPAPRPG